MRINCLTDKELTLSTLTSSQKSQTIETQYLRPIKLATVIYLRMVGNLKFFRLAFALANCRITFLKSKFLARSFSIDGRANREVSFRTWSFKESF